MPRIGKGKCSGGRKPALTTIHRQILSQEDDYLMYQMSKRHRVVGRNPRRDEEDQEKLASQHERWHGLQMLKRKRMSMFAEIDERRTCRSVTLLDELVVRRNRLRQVRDRPYLVRGGRGHALLRQSAGIVSAENFKSQSLSSFLDENIDENKDNAAVASYTTDDANVSLLHQNRLTHMLNASYRLSGVSVSIPTQLNERDDSVLALQFDVAVQGTFVACYQVLLQLMVATPVDELVRSIRSSSCRTDDSTQQRVLYLRFKHHSLPDPLSPILHQTMGDATWSPFRIGPLSDFDHHPSTDEEDDHDTNSDESSTPTNALPTNGRSQSRSLPTGVLDELQVRAHRLYRACCSYTLREHVLQQLQHLTSPQQVQLLSSHRGDRTSEAMHATHRTTIYYVDRVNLTSSNLSIRLRLAHVELETNGIDDDDDDDSSIEDASDSRRVQPALVDSRSVAVRVAIELEWRLGNVQPTKATVMPRGHGPTTISSTAQSRRTHARNGNAAANNNNNSNGTVHVIADDDDDDDDDDENDDIDIDDVAGDATGSDRPNEFWSSLSGVTANHFGQLSIRLAMENIVSKVVTYYQADNSKTTTTTRMMNGIGDW